MIISIDKREKLDAWILEKKPFICFKSELKIKFKELGLKLIEIKDYQPKTRILDDKKLVSFKHSDSNVLNELFVEKPDNIHEILLNKNFDATEIQYVLGGKLHLNDASKDKIFDVGSFNFKNYLEVEEEDSVLTKEEEQELFVRIKEGDQSAKKQIIRKNLKLVVSIAKRYQFRSFLIFPDVIFEGNFGLLRAIEKFDITKGYRFSTYAYCWIVQSITRTIAEKSKMIRIPVHWTELQHKIIKFSNEFSTKMFRAPTMEEISEGIKVKMKKLQHLQNLKNINLSLDQPISGDTHGKTIIDLLTTNELDYFETAMEDEKVTDLFNIINDNFKPPVNTMLHFRIFLLKQKTDAETKEFYNEIHMQTGLSLTKLKTLEDKALIELEKILSRQNTDRTRKNSFI